MNLKTITITILISSFLLLAGCSDSSSVEENQQTEKFEVQSESQQGIDVEIVGIKNIGEKVIVSFVVSNHQYDITKMNIVGLSLLNEEKSTDLKINNVKMGGHHIEGDLTFSGAETEGKLTIGLKQDLKFNFDL